MRLCIRTGLNDPVAGLGQREQDAVRLYRTGEMDQFTLAIAKVRLTECQAARHQLTAGREPVGPVLCAAATMAAPCNCSGLTPSRMVAAPASFATCSSAAHEVLLRQQRHLV